MSRSRWRELMMDFGQIFGTEKSYASSEVFSVESDLHAKKTSDIQLRRTLEVHFRPLFQQFVYGGEKIACHDLKSILNDPKYKDRLPADKVQELEDMVDFNKGRAIAYDEFVRICLGHVVLDDVASMDSNSHFGSNRQDKMRFQDTMFIMCKNTEPDEQVRERTQKYRCCPPPFFIISITLIQIVLFIVFSVEDDVATCAFKDVSPDNKLVYLPTRRREAWRFFTYFLVHQGYVDLILIAILQLFLSIPLEIVFSWWKVAIVYMLGVIAGSCVHSMVDHYAALAGGAAGCYALCGAHLYALITRWRFFNNNVRDSRKMRCLCSTTLRLIIILILLIVQLALAVYRRFFLDGLLLKIGFGYALAGLLLGISLSDACLRDHRLKPCELMRGFSFMLILIGCTIIVNICWHDYPLEDYS